MLLSFLYHRTHGLELRWSLWLQQVRSTTWVPDSAAGWALEQLVWEHLWELASTGSMISLSSSPHRCLMWWSHEAVVGQWAFNLCFFCPGFVFIPVQVFCWPPQSRCSGWFWHQGSAGQRLQQSEVTENTRFTSCTLTSGRIPPLHLLSLHWGWISIIPFL